MNIKIIYENLAKWCGTACISGLAIADNGEIIASQLSSCIAFLQSDLKHNLAKKYNIKIEEINIISCEENKP